MTFEELLLESSRGADREGTARLIRGARPAADQVYELPEAALSMGPSFGNQKCWARLLANGAVESLYAIDVGRRVAGSLLIRYSDPEHHFYLRPSTPRTVQLNPSHLRRRFDLPGGIRVQELTFVPNTAGGDGPAVLVIVDVTNESAAERRLDCFGFSDLSGNTDHDLLADWDSEREALVAHNRSNPEWVRVFGTSVPGSRYLVSRDFNLTLRETGVENLTNAIADDGDILGVLQVPLTLRPQESRQFAFVLTFSHEGAAAALTSFAEHRNFHHTFARTVCNYREHISLAEVMTPDPVINRGVLWAKVNMLRVQAQYPVDWGFTNDPGVSQNIVGRDVVWFVYGSDWMTPDFSRNALMAFARLQAADGKIIEYFNGQTGFTDDYGLNINDNTPLFVLGARHHHMVTGNRAFLDEIYPHVALAVRCILSQMNEQGLVFCDSRGTGMQGIAGWRNIIDGTNISGAVTEINSECYAALLAASELAGILGRAEEAAEYRREADRLKWAINRHLLNPESGLYYLNIDVDGVPHPEMSGDLVFPVMFGVAPAATAFKIVSRLNAPDFWTEGGLRTVSRDSPLYNPSANAGLLGGVWPGLSFWYAFSAAEYHPEFMTRMLHLSYAQYEADPRKNRTVPGEYAEWFDGEALTNGGMKLSPWEPPRYLWAAVEGACGIELVDDVLVIRPRMPSYWKWLGLRRLPYRNRHVTMFVARIGARIQVHATQPFTSPHPAEVWERDLSSQVAHDDPNARVVAFGRSGETLVAVSNTSRQSINVGLTMVSLFGASDWLHCRIFDSEQDTWSVEFDCDGNELQRFVVRVESEGFRLIRVSARS